VVLALDEDRRRHCDRRRLQTRTIRLLDIGPIEVRYESGRTAAGHVYPPALQAVAPPGMAFGWNVFAKVLRLRYVELRQRQQICADLAARGVPIAAGSVTRLSHLALGCLEQLHEAAAGALGDHYRQQAFIVHLDGTHEGGQWCHFVIREGLTGHVLLTRKIRTEHHDDITSMLRHLKELFGRPDVVLSDLSEPIRKAVKEVFRDVPHRLCHFHFLKAVGKTILGPDHDTLATITRRVRSGLLKIRRDCVERLRKGDKLQLQVIAMVDRINVHTGDLSGEGFPFDLPHLRYLQRCAEVADTVQTLLNGKRGDLAGGNGMRKRLVDLREHLLIYTQKDHPLPAMARLERREQLFSRVRDILHPVVEDTRAPLNWGRLKDPCRVADIDQRLAELRETARRRASCKTLTPSDTTMWKSLHRQLEAYGDGLVPVLEIRDATFVLPRTNNLSEVGFRDMKRKQRRTTGNACLKRQLDQMPPQVFYVENLACDTYRRLVLGNRPLSECFADTDWNRVRAAADTMVTPRRPGAIDHRLINRKDFFETVTAALVRPPQPRSGDGPDPAANPGVTASVAPVSGCIPLSACATE
jgi:hypothetical protein